MLLKGNEKLMSITKPNDKLLHDATGTILENWDHKRAGTMMWQIFRFSTLKNELIWNEKWIHDWLRFKTWIKHQIQCLP